jgi:hypothetical protein
MQRSFAALALAAVLLPLPLAAQAPDAELTLGQYQALDEQQRTLYIAGLSDMLDAAAAMAPRHGRLPVIAACTHGFAATELRQAVEAGAPDMQIKWADTAPAAQWFVQTMILVCQLQLPPPEQ